MGCTRRIRERILSVRNTISNTFFGLSAIAQAILHSQTPIVKRAMVDFKHEIPKLSEAPSLAYHALLDRNKSAKETDEVLKASTKRTLKYYVAPQMGILLTRSVLHYAIPNLEGSRISNSLDYLATGTMLLLLVKHAVDYMFDNISLKKAYTASFDRKIAKDIFYQMLPGLSRTMATTFARPEVSEDFYELFFSKMHKHMSNFFQDPESFHKITNNFEKEMADVMAIVFSDPSSKISAGHMSRLIASCLTKIILSKIVPNYTITKEELQLELTKNFTDMYTISQCLQDIFNYGSVAEKDNAPPLLVKRSTIYNLLHLPENLKTTELECKEALKIPLYALANTGFIFLVERFLPYGSILAFILTAEFYGRSILVLKTDEFNNSVAKDFSTRKMQSISIGLPFAGASILPITYFLKDAMLSMMLQWWSFAEHQDKRPWLESTRGLDTFYLPKKIIDLTLDFLTICKNIYQWIERQCSKNKIRIPFSRERFIELLIKGINSDVMHALLSIIFGNKAKWPSINFRPNSDPNSDSSFNLGITFNADASDIFLYQMQSMRLYLKFNAVNLKIDAEDRFIFSSLSLYSWLENTVVAQLCPNVIVLLLSFALRFFKENELRAFLRSMNAEIDRSNMASLKEDEQESKLVKSLSRPELSLQDKQMTIFKKSAEVEIKFFVPENKLANETKEEKDSKNNGVETFIEDAMSSSIFSSAASAMPVEQDIRTEVKATKAKILNQLEKEPEVDEIRSAIEDALTSSVLKNPSQEPLTKSQVPHINVIDNYSDASFWRKKSANLFQGSAASGIRQVRKA